MDPRRSSRCSITVLPTNVSSYTSCRSTPLASRHRSMMSLTVDRTACVRRSTHSGPRIVTLIRLITSPP